MKLIVVFFIVYTSLVFSADHATYNETNQAYSHPKECNTKRKQVAVACVHCRKSKIRCSKFRPCESCIKRRIICEDPTVARKLSRKKMSRQSKSAFESSFEICADASREVINFNPSSEVDDLDKIPSTRQLSEAVNIEEALEILNWAGPSDQEIVYFFGAARNSEKKHNKQLRAVSALK